MIKEHKNIICIYLIFMFCGIIPLLIYDNVELFLKINKKHNPFFDYFFYYISYFGNGYFYIFIFFLLTLSKISNRALFGAGVSFVVVTIIIKSMKKIFFSSHLRPYSLINSGLQIHTFHKVVLKQEASFPSGHSAVVFSMICFIMLLSKPKVSYLILFYLIALLVCYSRVYLSHHFYRDIYVGSLIGGLSTIFSFLFFYKIKNFATFLDNNIIDQLKIILASKFKI